MTEPDTVAPAVDGARRCSVASRAEGEPTEATAPHAVSWVGVVAPGSWPARAEGRLPEALTSALAAAGTVRLVLLRPVGRATSEVGVVLAGTLPGRTWLRQAGAEAAEDVLAALAEPGSPAVADLAAGRDPGLGRRVDRPTVLVCTNGARDACCAREGRPAAALLATRLAPVPRRFGRGSRGADVWESSHLGGHRFAPTAAVLPHGMLLGGLGAEPEPLATAVADLLAGRPVLDGYRGRSTYPPAEQAAEAAVRRHLAVIGVSAGPDDVRVDGSGPAEEGAPLRVLARHTGGRTFRVLVTRVGTEARRPASCGADPGPVVVWETEVDADPAPGVYLGG